MRKEQSKGKREAHRSAFFPRRLTPGITEKKVPPRHQSGYIGSTFDVVYRKLTVVEAPITFAIGS